MAYEKIPINSPNLAKIYEILMKQNYSMREAQRLIDKGRVLDENGKTISQKNALAKQIFLIDYKPKPLGLKPIFEDEILAVFDKPSGILSHPNGRHCEYSLCDEIWSLFGRKACVAHRLDKETSGLIIMAKDQKSSVKLKGLFEKKSVKKRYLALVRGKTDESFECDLAMDLAQNYDDIKTRMQICKDGKPAKTLFQRVDYFDDFSLLACTPITGRQHQIRLHLFALNLPIVGEPLYGLEKGQISEILDGKISPKGRLALTGATRLLLHSSEISFTLDDKEYKFKSKFKAKNEFIKAMKI